MKRAGHEDRLIASVSGHKNIATLSHYDPVPAIEQRQKLAAAIARSTEIIGIPGPSAPKYGRFDDISVDQPTADKPTADKSTADKPIAKKPIADELNDSFEEILAELDLPVFEKSLEDKENCVVLAKCPENQNLILTQGKTLAASKENVDPILVLLQREQDIVAQDSMRRQKNEEKRLALIEKILNKQ